ncbi:preprotein translocase subunit YajC [Caproiciproducens sp. MSJ-32]|uniref:preprotein translocase subunit YajC n=1 Tax=Caproiciproducens sp. MSJ-32 TaxID=2841527 RepID=UPI001C109DCF|nr:preprotein translocase subunit YajC [Caproiciproducens sp. MSJ-32]MBU5454319.1 preprotein translocase subunit YajC [Caproiciproducens sp. MSJ-32]
MEIIGVFLPFVGLFAVMYFMMILPEKKRNKQYKEMLSFLQKNDEIITKGGIIGRIIKIEEDNLVIETSAEKTRLKIVKNGVASKVNKEK